MRAALLSLLTGSACLVGMMCVSGNITAASTQKGGCLHILVLYDLVNYTHL